MAYKIGEVQRLYLGVQGEMGTEPIEIDCMEWLKVYPRGTISIYYRRPTTYEAYPVGARQDDTTGIVSWSPSLTDMELYGVDGEVQIRLTLNGTVKKSRIIPVKIDEALMGTMTDAVPDPIVPYVETIEGMKDQAHQSALDAGQAARDAGDAKDELVENINQLMPALEANLRQVVDASDRAVTSRDNAAASASAAQAAQEAAEDAQTKAEAAQEAAEDAKEAAEKAQAQASSYASSAASYRSAAQNYASNASNYASSASNAATNAKNYMNTASTSASTAVSAADRAVAAADRAEGAMDGKVDKTYVDAELAKKADAEAVKRVDGESTQVTLSASYISIDQDGYLQQGDWSTRYQFAGEKGCAYKITARGAEIRVGAAEIIIGLMKQKARDYVDGSGSVVIILTEDYQDDPTVYVNLSADVPITVYRVSKINGIYNRISQHSDAIAEQGESVDRLIDTGVWSREMTATLYGSRYLNTNGTPTTTNSANYKLYKVDVSQAEAVSVTTWKNTSTGMMPMMSFTTVAFEDATTSAAYTNTIVGSIDSLVKDFNGVYTREAIVPNEAKTLFISVANDYVGTFPVVTEKHYGAVKDAIDKSIIKDVTINGESIVSDGVATIPFAEIGASVAKPGVAAFSSAFSFDNTKRLQIKPASKSDINNINSQGLRTSTKAITPSNLSVAVLSEFTNPNLIPWTAEQQAAARERLGIVTLTQEQYDLIESPSASTIYIIVDGDGA